VSRDWCPNNPYLSVQWLAKIIPPAFHAPRLGSNLNWKMGLFGIELGGYDLLLVVSSPDNSRILVLFGLCMLPNR
jgi:hypothetical protein